MTIGPYELMLISGVFGIVGVLLGAWVTYRFALVLSERGARREAGRRLRAAFAPELAALHPVSGDKTTHKKQLLEGAFPRHRNAVVEFEFYLSGAERAAFEKAWRQYYEVGGSVRFFDYYMTDGTGRNPYDTFKQRVEAILRFTGA